MTESTTPWNTGPVIWEIYMSIWSYLYHDQIYCQRVDAEMKLQTPGVKDLHLDDQPKMDSAESDHPKWRSTILCVSAILLDKYFINGCQQLSILYPWHVTFRLPGPLAPKVQIKNRFQAIVVFRGPQIDSLGKDSVVASKLLQLQHGSKNRWPKSI